MNVRKSATRILTLIWGFRSDEVMAFNSQRCGLSGCWGGGGGMWLKGVQGRRRVNGASLTLFVKNVIKTEESIPVNGPICNDPEIKLRFPLLRCRAFDNFADSSKGFKVKQFWEFKIQLTIIKLLTLPPLNVSIGLCLYLSVCLSLLLSLWLYLCSPFL